MALNQQELASALAYLAQRRWADSANAFARACGEAGLGVLSPQDQLRRNLAANFAELAAHRPDVATSLDSAPADPRFSLDITPSGRPTLRYTAPGQPGKRLCAGDDPLQSLASAMHQLLPAREAAQPLILLGTGDGYLLTALARHPRPLPLGRQQCIYLVEPNPGNLLLTMMLHDWTGDAGPIRQRRVHFCVGPDAIKRFEAMLDADLYLPFPEVNVASEPDGVRLARALPDILGRMLRRDQARKAEIHRRYAMADLAQLAAVTSDTPPRKPRALLLTSVFTTVLQYSTADTARALRELGWEVEVAIEPSKYHTLTLPAIRQLILDHRPDLILQIDHLRAEHGDLFPATIPFLCWTQDHLPNLTRPEAGASQGPLDFLLTNHGPWYTRNFGYPAGRHIALGKLTRVPEIPPAWSSDGPDLCYVSNWSKRPEAAMADVQAAFAAFPVAAGLVEPCVRRIEVTYARGGSFAGTMAIRELVSEVAAEQGVTLPPALLTNLATELFERVNNSYYRQQALLWAADLADRLGLTLAVYGNGWADHPRLGRYARGPVAYGADLEALTRAAKINLQVVPYFCLHQRLLDGLAAGGFYLVREHPSDSSVARLAGFLERHAPAARDLPQALAATPPQHHAELRKLAQANAFIADRLDPVELVRVFTDQGLFAGGAVMPPRIDEVSFSSPQSLEDRVRQYLADPALRRTLVMQQRSAIAGTLSYTAGLRRVIGELHKHLARMAASSRHAIAA